jgi:hypothetical protein
LFRRLLRRRRQGPQPRACFPFAGVD